MLERLKPQLIKYLCCDWRPERGCRSRERMKNRRNTNDSPGVEFRRKRSWLSKRYMLRTSKIRENSCRVIYGFSPKFLLFRVSNRTRPTCIHKRTHPRNVNARLRLPPCWWGAEGSHTVRNDIAIIVLSSLSVRVPASDSVSCSGALGCNTH